MLILLFSGSQTSITAFEAMVTSAAVLAKGSSAWEDFFYTWQISIKSVLTDLDSPFPFHELFVVFLRFPQLP